MRAGILFDPHSVPEMARAISDVLLDRELRARLERLGTQRAASFSWEQAAQRTLDVYYDVARRRVKRCLTLKARVVVVMKSFLFFLCLRSRVRRIAALFHQLAQRPEPGRSDAALR